MFGDEKSTTTRCLRNFGGSTPFCRIDVSARSAYDRSKNTLRNPGPAISHCATNGDFGKLAKIFTATSRGDGGFAPATANVLDNCIELLH